MQLLSIGINYHTAPLALRERVAFPLDQIKPALQTLKQAWLGRNRKNNPHSTSRSGLIVPQIELSEAAILSTCNRTELYCASDEHSVREQAIAWLSQYHNVPAAELAPHVYALPQSDAVRHAFRVASGLDSMVLGETQILGQIKDAVRTASEAGAMGTYLHQLFQRSFAVAKEVRRQTEIGMHSVSMAAAAVRLAQRIFESIGDQRILFIGAGEMIELCATHFAAHQPRALVIANRTAARSCALAQRCNGSTLPLASLPAQLHQFDIVISCTASTLPIIGLGAVESALRARRRRPMFMVDLAVPRDIEPEIGQIEDVFLYTIDDLGSIVREGHAQRQAAVAQAEAIIEKQVRHFMQWLETRSVVPVIHNLHQQADQMRNRELERARKMLARGDDPDTVLEALSRSLTNKFLHGPTRALKSVNTHERETLVTLLPGLFQE